MRSTLRCQYEDMVMEQAFLAQMMGLCYYTVLRVCNEIEPYGDTVRA